MKVILPLSIPIMIFLLSLFLSSCSSSNAPEISTFATTDSSLDPKFSPDNNIFLECDTIEDKVERYNCYKDVSLYAMQHGANVEQLFEFISETKSSPERISHHLKKHSIGRAALIVSDYNLSLVKEKCMPQNCVQPYYHAIAEEWAEYAPSKVTEYIDFLNSFCPLEDPKDENCWHNAGHFYQSVNKSFKENLALCNDLKHNAPFVGCITGIIHEQFIQSGPKNFFELCNSELPDRIKEICYIRGSRLYARWLSDNPIEACHELNGKIPNELNMCYKRAASLLENKGKTPNLKLCEGLDDSFKEFCINGLSSPERFLGSPGCSIDQFEHDGESEGIGCRLKI